jgi:hypothetical protein
MNALDKLCQDIKTARSPFALGQDWDDIQAGFAALMDWRQQVEKRLAALEAKVFEVKGTVP